ncbi:hypothetical protein AVEN_118744-1 [Araneus ventricosus]|uniref:Uncharacterized protein n=1 Tax=Araneus ventricosus TaxID=182803 RepID=A0A4Y2BVS6_ARAVE|nr:hypothetical protein AVEN_118744-1 [Araneus ventricosus]
MRVERFATGSRTVRTNYFHDEPIANHGKGANPLRIINHLLSVANGRRRSLEYAWPYRFDGGSQRTTNYTRTRPNRNCESFCVRRNTDKIWFDATGSGTIHFASKAPFTHANQLLVIGSRTD